MKIAVSSTGPDLESQIDPRFGRCQYFLIVDLDTMGFEALSNASAGQQGGAGIQSAKVVSEKGAQAVLTGNVGPNAYQVLSEVGLHVITGVSGTVRDACQQYKEGQLRPVRQPNVDHHFGAGSGQPLPPSEADAQVPASGFGAGRGGGVRPTHGRWPRHGMWPWHGWRPVCSCCQRRCESRLPEARA